MPLSPRHAVPLAALVGFTLVTFDPIASPARADVRDDRAEYSTPALNSLGFRDWTLRLLTRGRNARPEIGPGMLAAADVEDDAPPRERPRAARPPRARNLAVSLGEPDARERGALDDAAGVAESADADPSSAQDAEGEHALSVARVKLRRAVPLGAQPAATPTELGIAALPSLDGESPTLELAFPSAGEASLQLFDVAGRRLDRVAVGASSPGRRIVALDTHRVPRGVYFLLLTQGPRVAVLQLARR